MRFASVEPSKDSHSPGDIDIPGSKSYSLRALFISKVCGKEADLENLLESDDSTAMQKALDDIYTGRPEIFVNESGITARFVTALACMMPGQQIISGRHGLNSRPIKDLVEALINLGAEIEYIDKEGFPPIKIMSEKLSKNHVSVNGNISSQYLSALLLIAPLLENGLSVEVKGSQTSKPYIDMTLDIMSKFGVDVINDNYKKYEIKSAKYIPAHYKVEADYSSAAYFFAIASLNNSEIEINNLPRESKQADKNFLTILEKMGARIKFSENSVKVIGAKLKPINVDMNNCPDQVMTAAVLASFANGRSTIKGIASLRLKESDRVEALQNELSKMGIMTRAKKDSLTIFGGNPKPARIDTYGDHRIAMSFAVAATKLPGIKIISPEVVNKSFPGFWAELSKLYTIKIQEEEKTNILLVGMRGTGKSTTGKLLARILGKEFIDMDKYIEKKEGKKIRDIVLDSGWDYFRKLERQAAIDTSKYTNHVIASGGGVVLNTENIKNLRKDSIVVLINANPKILTKRIRKDANRLGLTNQPTLLGELSEVWKERRELYFDACDFVVNSDKLNSKRVARKIVDKIS